LKSLCYDARSEKHQIIYGMFNGTIFRPKTQEIAGGEKCNSKVVPTIRRRGLEWWLSRTHS